MSKILLIGFMSKNAEGEPFEDCKAFGPFGSSSDIDLWISEGGLPTNRNNIYEEIVDITFNEQGKHMTGITLVEGNSLDVTLPSGTIINIEAIDNDCEIVLTKSGVNNLDAEDSILYSEEKYEDDWYESEE